MAANNFNLGNNNAGLLPPVGQPVVPPLPLGNMAAAAAPAGEIPAADLLNLMADDALRARIREYVSDQQEEAVNANLNGLSQSYLILLTLLDGNPISEAQKAILLENLPEIRINLEKDMRNIFNYIAIEFFPDEIRFEYNILMTLYLALNKVDGRSAAHVFGGNPKDNEPKIPEDDIDLFKNIVSSLSAKLQGLIEDELEGEVPEALRSARDIKAMLDNAEGRINVGEFPRDPVLTFLIDYLSGAADAIMADQGVAWDVLDALRTKCLEVREFRTAAAPAEAPAAANPFSPEDMAAFRQIVNDMIGDLQGALGNDPEDEDAEQTREYYEGVIGKIDAGNVPEDWLLDEMIPFADLEGRNQPLAQRIRDYIDAHSPPVAGSPFSPADMAELREAAVGMRGILKPDYRVQFIINRIDAGRLPKIRDLEMLAGAVDDEEDGNPAFAQRVRDYIAARALAPAAAAVAHDDLIYPFQGDMAELNQLLLKLSREAFDDDNEPKAKQWDALRKVFKGEALPEDEDTEQLMEEWGSLFVDMEDNLMATFFTEIGNDQYQVYYPLQIGIALLKSMNKKLGKAENDVLGGVPKRGETKIPEDKKAEFIDMIDNFIPVLNERMDDVDPIAERLRQDNLAYLIQLFVSAKEKIAEGIPLDEISIFFLDKYLVHSYQMLEDEGEEIPADKLRALREILRTIMSERRNPDFNPPGNLNVNEQNARFLQRIRPENTNDNNNRNWKEPELKSVRDAKAILDGAGGEGGAPVDLGGAARGRVEQKLIQCFFENWKEMENKPAATEKDFLQFMRKFLTDNEAVIAGGFILKNIDAELYKSGAYDDLDVYVPCRHLKGFNLTWAKLVKATKVSQFAASLYCVSFLRKNGIRSVQKLIPDFEECNISAVDVMAVRNSRSVLDVVQNFDLTFCQVWYDGRSVFATHPTHVKERVGYLQKDYVPLYVQGNIFLRTRMKKYTRRGFRILLDPLCGKVFESFDIDYHGWGNKKYGNNKPGQQPKDDEYFNHWAAHVLLKYFTEGSYVGESREFGATLLKKATNIQVIDPTVYTVGVRPQSRKTRGLKNGIPFDVATAKYVHPSDGYDSEDLDIDAKDTFYPAITQGFSDDKFPDLGGITAQDDEHKFYHLVFNLFAKMISPFPGENIFVKRLIYYPEETRYEGDDRTDYRVPKDMKRFFDTFKGYFDKLRPLTSVEDMDPITLDEAQVFHIHEHKPDEATSRESLENYLKSESITSRTDKTSIPCYIPGCRKFLTMSEIHAIVSPEFYEEFAKYTPPIPNMPLINSAIQIVNITGEVPPITASVTDIFRNTKTADDDWGAIYHYVMCPYCLEFIKRESGCMYVYHDNPSGKYTIMPYCNPKNLVEDIFKKYQNADVRSEMFRYSKKSLEVCVECGRPCMTHMHFNTIDPLKLIDSRGQYGRCNGGGRRELVARILAVRKTMRENPDMGALELRRACAFAADAAPNDAELLAKADQILAIEAGKRGASQMNQVLDGAAPTPIEPPGPVAAVAANAENEAPIGAVGNVFEANGVENPLAGIAGNIFAGGKRTVGKPYTCSHGYTNSYKEKIQQTRKHSHGNRRMTRKKIEQ